MRQQHVPNYLAGRIRWVVTALAVLLVSIVVVRTQQAPPPAGPPARPLVPVAASSIANYPATYYGENVSMTGAVEAILSKTAFTVDQDRKGTGKVVLVIAQYMSGLVEPNSYVTVIGDAIKFDPAEIAKRLKTYRIDLPPDFLRSFQGPVVLATSVVTPALIDVAKRVLPPPTPAEIALDKAMKSITPSINELRGSLDKSSAETAKQQLATLRAAFGEAESFFKAAGPANAVGLAQEALKHVTAIEQAVAGAKWEDAKTSVTGLGTSCAPCHGTLRDRQDDGSYRVRPPGAP